MCYAWDFSLKSEDKVGNIKRIKSKITKQITNKLETKINEANFVVAYGKYFVQRYGWM